MYSSLEILVKKFLDLHCQPEKPILLGLSGGPDSLCLFHLLLDYKQRHPLSLHIAHVNHGWREESEQEAEEVSAMACFHQIPCHILRLSKEEYKGNLEADSRRKRLAFFSSIAEKVGAQAVLLAHHADDLVETFLKKILEGVSFVQATAMAPITFIGTLAIWRPFLSVRRSEILQWMNQRGLKGFMDPTNLDQKFLRGRMRTTLLPQLSAQFGKEVSRSLLHLHKESEELKNYLKSKIDPHLEKVSSSGFGYSLDLSAEAPFHPVELKELIRAFCAKGDLSLSYEALQTVISFVQTGKANGRVTTGAGELQIDRRRLFIPKHSLRFPLSSSHPLALGKIYLNPWWIEAYESSHSEANTSWKEAWEGQCQLCVPSGDYTLEPPELKGFRQLDRWWTQYRVPAFLRPLLPIVKDEKGEVYEFLTGKSLMKRENKEKFLRIELTFSPSFL